MERFCKYCGTNITHTKLDRITCYSNECLHKHEKFIRKNQKKENFCVICGGDISHKHKKSKVCDNYECIKEYRREYYKNKIVKKICRDCGCEFNGSIKQILCEKCGELSKYTNFLKPLKVSILCEKCGCIIDTVEKFNSRNINEVKHGLCSICLNEKEKNTELEKLKKKELKDAEREKCRLIKSKILSERMKTKNPSFKDGQTSKKLVIKRNAEEIKKEASERMRKNNPMFNKDSREKMSKTFRTKLENGEIKYKRGKDNKRWKGLRIFNKHCRISLRSYVKNELINSDFTCHRCGKHGIELHVHHTEPLREIIEKFLLKYNIDGTCIMENYELLEIVTNEIIKYHNENKPTIVVCKNCHDEVDEYYHSSGK